MDTVLDATELRVLLVQLTKTDIFRRHLEGERTRDLTLDGINVIALCRLRGGKRVHTTLFFSAPRPFLLQ